MLGKTLISLRKSAWLLALLIITSALPASAQEHEPYLFEETEGGYIMKPRPYETYEGGLYVPAVRESDGKPIVGVDEFSYQTRLLGIIFAEGSQVKYIGSFEGCTGIEFIDNMPATVEKIADYAFNGCTMLREVTLNEGLKYIGISCFEGCESLESIKLPKSLKVLRENAFRVCTALQTVEFDDNINFHDGYSYGFYNNVFDGCESLHTVNCLIIVPIFKSPIIRSSGAETSSRLRSLPPLAKSDSLHSIVPVSKNLTSPQLHLMRYSWRAITHLLLAKI